MKRISGYLNLEKSGGFEKINNKDPRLFIDSVAEFCLSIYEEMKGSSETLSGYKGINNINKSIIESISF